MHEFCVKVHLLMEPNELLEKSITQNVPRTSCVYNSDAGH